MSRSFIRLDLWDRLLQAAIALVGLSGLFFVVFGAATASLFERLIYGTGGNPISGAEALVYTQFVYGVLGAVMIGWAVALWFVVAGPFRRREPWAWRAVTASSMTWFVVDSTLSLASGYGENALLNLVFATMFAVPLAATQRCFRTTSSARR